MTTSPKYDSKVSVKYTPAYSGPLPDEKMVAQERNLPTFFKLGNKSRKEFPMFKERHFGNIYVAAGYTDLRSGVNSLASIVQDTFKLNPFSDSLFLFCGRRADRMKALYWDKSGSIVAGSAPTTPDTKRSG